MICGEIRTESCWWWWWWWRWRMLRSDVVGGGGRLLFLLFSPFFWFSAIEKVWHSLPVLLAYTSWSLHISSNRLHGRGQFLDLIPPCWARASFLVKIFIFFMSIRKPRHMYLCTWKDEPYRDLNPDNLDMSSRPPPLPEITTETIWITHPVSLRPHIYYRLFVFHYALIIICLKVGQLYAATGDLHGSSKIECAIFYVCPKSWIFLKYNVNNNRKDTF